MPKPIKIEQVKEIREDLDKSQGFFVTDYRGLKVSEDHILRRKLRDVGSEFKVVKNTLFELAVGGTIDPGLKQLLEGPTAVVFVEKDPVASAKTLTEFAREHKAMSVKGGFIDGHVYDAVQVVALSKVPPKDVLIAQMLGAMQGPITSFVGTLQGVMSNFVFTLQAVADQKAG